MDERLWAIPLQRPLVPKENILNQKTIAKLVTCSLSTVSKIINFNLNLKRAKNNMSVSMTYR